MITFLILFSISCNKNIPETIEPPIEEIQKLISSVSFIKYDGLLIDSGHVVMNYNKDTINILVNPGTCLENLIPVIQYQGLSISPQSGVAQNFLSPVSYTVTDSNGKTYTYIVTVSWSNQNGMVYMGSNSYTFYAFDAVMGGSYWRYTAQNGNFSYSSPAVEKGIVYAGATDGKMYAFDAARGDLLWTFQTQEAIESGPAIKNGIVYFGSGDDYFYAIDALNGKLKWKYKTAYNVSNIPVVVNNMVYTGSDDGNLYAFDAATGDVKWIYSTGSMFNASSPVYDNGIIFIGNRDGNLYAVDAVTGLLKWKYFNGGISLEQSRATVYNNIVYIAGWYDINNFHAKGSVYAIDANTGSLTTTYLDSLAFSSSPFVQNDKLYISADDGNFYCVSTKTNNVIWKKPILPNGATPLVVDNVVYIGGGGTRSIYALDAETGETKWNYPYDSGMNTSMPCFFAANGSIYHSNIPKE